MTPNFIELSETCIFFQLFKKLSPSIIVIFNATHHFRYIMIENWINAVIDPDHQSTDLKTLQNVDLTFQLWKNQFYLIFSFLIHIGE